MVWEAKFCFFVVIWEFNDINFTVLCWFDRFIADGWSWWQTHVAQSSDSCTRRGWRTVRRTRCRQSAYPSAPHLSWCYCTSHARRWARACVHLKVRVSRPPTAPRTKPQAAQTAPQTGCRTRAAPVASFSRRRSPPQRCISSHPSRYQAVGRGALARLPRASGCRSRSDMVPARFT